MLILPDRQIPRAHVLMPLSPLRWRQPSQHAVDCGIQDQQWWSLEAVTSDGVRFWRGWFEDRCDADAFLWHMALGNLPRDIRRLPQRASGLHTPWVRSSYPSIYEGEWLQDWADLPLSYHFSSFVFNTSSAGSNVTATSPADWNNGNNEVHTIGGGAAGSASRAGSNRGGAAGGGGAAQNFITNFSFATPGTTTYVRRAGAGGTAVIATSNGTGVTGTVGGDSWFNATTLAGSSCGSKGGSAGTFDTIGPGVSVTGGSGGAAASGVGSGFDGGDGAGAGFAGGTGGGGAGGTTGAGSSAGFASTLGGNGGPLNGGVHGANVLNSGGAGTTWNDGSNDAGAGAGGNGSGSNGTTASGSGGLYGGAGAGSATIAQNATSGAGAQGIVVLIYTLAGSSYVALERGIRGLNRGVTGSY